MRLLKIFSILLILVFPMAEIGRIQFSNGVAISLNDIFLGALLIAFVIYVLRKKKKINFKKSFLLKSIAIFSTIGFISLLLNLFNLSFDRFLISFLYLARFVAYALIYFIFKEFDAKFKQKINYALIFSGSMVVLLGFVQYFFYPSLRNLFYLGWDEHLYRLFSSFLDPNFAGAFFAIFSLFVVNFIPDLFKKKKWLMLSIFGMVLISTISALYLTYSRSALILFVVGVVTYLALKNKKKLIVVALVGMILLIFLLPKSFQTEGTNFLRITSSNSRIDSASEAIKIFSKSPIYGVGFNAYRYAQNKLGMNNSIWQVTHSGAGTDNCFLFVLATTGIVGFIAYLYLLFKIMRLGILKRNKNKYAIALVSSLTGLVVGSIFVNSLFYVFILEWIWIIAALTESS